MADLSYPFRLASWHASRFIMHPDKQKNKRNDKIHFGIVGVLTAAAMITGVDHDPDATPIEGQDAKISAYEQQINALDDFYTNNVETARETWRTSSLDNKDAAEAAANQAHASFNDHAQDVLMGIYTETGVSETELAGLLEQFTEKVGDISSFEFDEQSFPDIGDAAHLHEAQAQFPSADTEKERAFMIAQEASKNENDEVFVSTIAPFAGLGAYFIYGFLATLLLGGTGLLDRAQKTAKRPAPKSNRSTGGFKH